MTDNTDSKDTNFGFEMRPPKKVVRSKSEIEKLLDGLRTILEKLRGV